MCAIYGIWRPGGLLAEDRANASKLGELLHHRGPDGEGTWVHEASGLILGHRRLAIIDLDARSAQPMRVGHLATTFNGEIYNYPELRDRLGGHFRTTGDTEVLVRAWERWGAACLDMLDGMFAAAIWDGTDLHLVTDGFGEKPLYWLRTGGALVFASEARALIELFGLEFAPTDAERQLFTALGFLPFPDTAHPGLHGVGPGRHLVFRGGTGIRDTRWWTPAPPRSGDADAFADSSIAAVRDHLLVALERRIRSDVPLGLFLSGGVDSALVAALVARELGKDVEAFTVAFPDGYDEAPYAEGIARHLGLRWREIPGESVRTHEFQGFDLPQLYGAPVDNRTAISVYAMSRVARAHITVALSGLGGDELFHGYNKYFRLRRWRHLHRIGRAVPTGLARAPLPSRIRNLLVETSGSAGRRLLFQKLGNGEEVDSIDHRLVDPLLPPGPDLAARVREFDLLHTLPGNYIPAIDRGSMRASLEVRTPFLYRPLADHLAGLDVDSLRSRGPKGLLRRLLEIYLPLDLLTPKKQGFIAPPNPRFRASSAAPGPFRRDLLAHWGKR